MCYTMVPVLAIILLVRFSPHWTGAMNTGFHLGHAAWVLMGGLGFFFFELIPEVTVHLVLLHQPLYDL